MLFQFNPIQQERSRTSFGIYLFAGMLILLAIGLHITGGIEKHMDILLWDEANYLNRGLWMFARIPRVWGPSYSAWYKFISYIEPDRIALYYLNYKLMTIGTALVGFLFLNACGVKPWIALLLCTFLLLSTFNLPVWPKISHYCILIVMAAVIVSKYTKDVLAKWCIFSLALLVCAYARPELFLSFACCMVITAVTGIRRFSKSNTPVRLFFALTLLWAAFICWFYKTPFNSGDSGRSLKVFYQHFTMNYIQWHHLNLAWWLEWQEVIARNFKHPETLASILQYDAPLFFRHILANAGNFITGLGSLTGQFFIPMVHGKVLLTATGFIASLLYLLPFKYKDYGKRLQHLLADNQLTFLFLLLFILPSIPVCIYAYPRAHYLVLWIPVLLLFFGLLLSDLVRDEMSYKRWIALAIGILVCWLAPDASGFNFYQLERMDRTLANQQTLRYLQEKEPADTLRLFDLEGDLSAMLSGKYKGYTNEYLREQPLSLPAFLDNNHIDMVYVTPVLLNFSAVQRDTAFVHLLNKPGDFGFYPEKTGNFKAYLLTRKRS